MLTAAETDAGISQPARTKRVRLNMLEGGYCAIDLEREIDDDGTECGIEKTVLTFLEFVFFSKGQHHAHTREEGDTNEGDLKEIEDGPRERSNDGIDKVHTRHPRHRFVSDETDELTRKLSDEDGDHRPRDRILALGDVLAVACTHEDVRTSNHDEENAESFDVLRKQGQ